MLTSSTFYALPDGHVPCSDPLAYTSCNWVGGHAVALAMDWYGNKTLAATPFTNITVYGTPIAAVQNVDNFSFAWVLSRPQISGSDYDFRLDVCTPRGTKWCVIAGALRSDRC